MDNKDEIAARLYNRYVFQISVTVTISVLFSTNIFPNPASLSFIVLTSYVVSSIPFYSQSKAGLYL